MSPSYLLPCPCGQKISVSTRNAGEQVRCACGAEQQAPRLSELRRLPQEEAAVAPSAPAWGFGQGVLAASLALCVPLLGIALYLRTTEPEIPERFNPVEYNEDWATALNEADPQKLFIYWGERYLPLSTMGLTEYEFPAYDSAVREREQLRLYQSVLAGAAGVTLLGGLVAFFAQPRKI